MQGRVSFLALNRTLNPALGMILRSPAHGLASGRFALITYTGRRSRREYTIPVLYRDKGDEVTIAVGWPDRKVWWRNLTGEGGPVRLVVRGQASGSHPPRRSRPRSRGGCRDRSISSSSPSRRWHEGGQVDNDIDGSVLEAQPGRSQGRPLKSRARGPSRVKRPVQPAFSRKPLSQSADRRSGPGCQLSGWSFMPRRAATQLRQPVPASGRQAPTFGSAPNCADYSMRLETAQQNPRARPRWGVAR